MNDELDTLQKVELALLRAEHQKRFQVQIAFVKEKVGEGVEYRNPLMRVVVSNEGAYYEFNDLPEEFCGATGDEIRQHAISQPDALARFAKAVASIKKLKPHNARHFQLMAIYTRRGLVDRTNCFIYDWDVARAARGQPPTEVGKYQPSVMPLFFKIKMDADFSKEVMGMSKGGIAFCMKNEGDRHLFIEIPYDTDNLINLAELPEPSTVN